jgi:hypothetical protein
VVDLDGAAVDMIRRGNIAAVLRGRGRCGVILCRVTGRVAVPRERVREFSTGGWHWHVLLEQVATARGRKEERGCVRR